MPPPAPAPAGRAALAVLAIAAIYWAVYGLFGRTISTDDGISLLAAEGIRDHGIPLLRSGQLYDRAYLAHYVVALVTWALGVNDASIRLPGYLASLGTLWLAHRLALRAFADRFASVAAPLIVALCGTQVYYATSPRMYGLHAFFCAWACLAAYRAFVEGSRRHVAHVLVAVALGFACERGIGLLAIGIAVAAVVLSVRRHGWPSLAGVLVRPTAAEVGAGLLLAASVALVLHHPDGALVPVVVEGGNVTVYLGAGYTPGHLLRHLVQLDGYLPGTLWLVPLALVLGPGRRGDGAGPAPDGPLFLLVLWGVAALLAGAGLTVVAPRLVSFLIAPQAALAGGGAALLVRRWHEAGPRAAVVPAAISIAVLLAAIAGCRVIDPWGMRWYYRPGWRLPHNNAEGHPQIATELRRLRTQLGPGDLVFTSDPWVTDMYLGRTDGLLRQRSLGGGAFGRFDVERDEYYGAPIIDDPEEIAAAAARLPPGARLWLVVDHKLDRYASPAYRAYIAEHFLQANQSERIRFHVTRL